MHIYLVRHGETTGDVEGRYGGDYDDHLSPRGIAQSKELAAKLMGKGIKLVLHSPKTRATETARIIGQAVNASLLSVPELRERNQYGVITGLTKAEALARHPDAVAELARHPYLHHTEGSEPYERFHYRISHAFSSIIPSQYAPTIAIVTHGGPIRCFVREILKKGEIAMLGDCAIFELNLEGKAYSLISVDGAAF